VFFESVGFLPNYTALQPITPHYLTVPAVGTSNSTRKHLVSIQISLLCEPSCQVDNRLAAVLFKRVPERVSRAAML
jgi:hypothetical protein